MKKIILAASAIVLSICLAACGTSDNDATLNNLSRQLDETSNVVTNIQTVNPSDINISNAALSTNQTIAAKSEKTNSSLSNEENYKSDILKRTVILKNCLAKDIKLSKAQISAVKELTQSLTKYTNSVSYTESEMANATKSIAGLKKNLDKNSDKINAKLNRLACNSNARSAYYENIIKTLEELEVYLCAENEESKNSSTNAKNSSTANSSDAQNDAEAIKNSTAQNTTNSDESIKNSNAENGAKGSKKSDEVSTAQDDNDTSNKNAQTFTPNIDTYLPQETSKDRTSQSEQDASNEQNSADDVYNRYQKFSGIRNTDTYAPMDRNIDSFGGNDFRYGYGNPTYNAPYTPYGYGNGIYRNGAYNGIYGNGTYGNGVYGSPNAYGINSNNINRLAPGSVLADAQANSTGQDDKDFDEENDDKVLDTKQNSKAADSKQNAEVLEAKNEDATLTTQQEDRALDAHSETLHQEQNVDAINTSVDGSRLRTLPNRPTIKNFEQKNHGKGPLKEVPAPTRAH